MVDIGVTRTLTERLSLTVGVPFVASSYAGDRQAAGRAADATV